MVLVDTSVIIEFLKGRQGDKVALFAKVLDHGVPFGISAYTYQEILQGARDEAEFRTLQGYLSTQHIYYLCADRTTYDKAAMLYFTLRRKGITPRGTLDVLIALTAMENDLALLHDDRDFDIMAERIPELRILRAL
jgi:predicted nucleic acid-binding protein